MSKIAYEELREAQERIQEHLADAYASIAKAQEISIETGVGFDFCLTWGAGAWFDPEIAARGKDEYGYDADGWVASSVQGC